MRHGAWLGDGDRADGQVPAGHAGVVAVWGVSLLRGRTRPGGTVARAPCQLVSGTPTCRVDGRVVLLLERAHDHVQPARASPSLGAVEPREPAVPACAADPPLVLLRRRARPQPLLQVVGGGRRGLDGVRAVPLAARLAGLDRGKTRRPHLAACDVAQRGRSVHLRPLALRAPRRPALRVPVIVDGTHEAVDPPVLQRDLDRFRRRDRLLAARLLPVDEPDLRRRLVVRIEPPFPVSRVARGDLDHAKAFSPVSARPISSFWIWLVPSYSVVTRASRRYFPTGYSSM